MDSSLTSAIIGALVAVIATHLFSDRQRSRETEQLRQTVRKLLSVEIEENRRYMLSFINEVGFEGANFQGRAKEYSAEERKRAWAMIHRFAELGLPPTQDICWKSQLITIPSALNDREIEVCMGHYTQLRKLQSLKTSIDTLEPETHLSIPPGDSSVGFQIGQRRAIAERKVLELWHQTQVVFDAFQSFEHPFNDSVKAEPKSRRRFHLSD